MALSLSELRHCKRCRSFANSAAKSAADHLMYVLEHVLSHDRLSVTFRQMISGLIYTFSIKVNLPATLAMNKHTVTITTLFFVLTSVVYLTTLACYLD